MKFTASRLSDGNKVFPDEITIDDYSVTIKSPKLFGGVSKSFPLGQISVKVNTPMIGYSDITLFSQGTGMSVHGFTSSDAKSIKSLIENGSRKEIEENLNKRFNRERGEDDEWMENLKKQNSRGRKYEEEHDNDTEIDNDYEIVVRGLELGYGYYEGECKNSTPHGKGKLKYEDGNFYDGNFVNGDFSGNGKFKWSDGDIYEGNYISGKKSGFGIYKWTSGNIYQGEWFNNERTGYGKFTWKDGNFYEGDFINGVFTGKGKMIEFNNDIVRTWECEKMKIEFRLGFGIFHNYSLSFTDKELDKQRKILKYSK